MKASRLVIKFGGNVLSAPDGLSKAANIIARQVSAWDEVLIVTAALSGVTNRLHQVVRLAQGADRHTYRAEVAALREMHQQATATLNLPGALLQTLWRELDGLFFSLLESCDLLAQKGQASPALSDQIVAMGERFITRIMAAAGRNIGLPSAAVDANRFIITDERHANARPINSLSQRNLNYHLIPLLEQKIIPIITGYIGATEKGAVTTLGRGGSDYTATYLASLLPADEVWFYTEVEGLMSADPALVETARRLPTSSYQEVSEMAHFGARVLHPNAIEPLMGSNIPLRLRPFARPEDGGTYIYDQPSHGQAGLHALSMGLGVLIRSVRRRNLVEVCNRLFSQQLGDDIQPTLHIENYAKTLAVYVAPTSVNPEVFYAAAAQARPSDDLAEWQIQPVSVLALIGQLNMSDLAALMHVLHEGEFQPLAMGQGENGVFLVVMPEETALAALRAIHTLVI